MSPGPGKQRSGSKSTVSRVLSNAQQCARLGDAEPVFTHRPLEQEPSWSATSKWEALAHIAVQPSRD